MMMKVLLCLVLALGAIGCVDNRGGGGGGGSCASACEERAEACGGSADGCASACSTASALADRVDCRAEFNAVQACFADHASACGTDLDILCSDESDVLAACSRAFCGADPTDAFCVDGCVSLCESLAFTCGFGSEGCEQTCRESTNNVAITGCGAEYFERLACQAERGACSFEEAETLCPAEYAADLQCFDRFCAANPGHPNCAAP